MILPLLWMLSTSFKETSDVFALPPRWIPEALRPRNYIDAWTAVPFGRFYLNSLFVAITVTIGQVSTSALAAYAFARIRFPGRDRLFFGYLATLIVPGSGTYDCVAQEWFLRRFAAFTQVSTAGFGATIPIDFISGRT